MDTRAREGSVESKEGEHASLTVGTLQERIERIRHENLLPVGSTLRELYEAEAHFVGFCLEINELASTLQNPNQVQSSGKSENRLTAILLLSKQLQRRQEINAGWRVFIRGKIESIIKTANDNMNVQQGNELYFCIEDSYRISLSSIKKEEWGAQRSEELQKLIDSLYISLLGKVTGRFAIKLLNDPVKKDDGESQSDSLDAKKQDKWSSSVVSLSPTIEQPEYSYGWAIFWFFAFPIIGYFIYDWWYNRACRLAQGKPPEYSSGWAVFWFFACPIVGYFIYEWYYERDCRLASDSASQSQQKSSLALAKTTTGQIQAAFSSSFLLSSLPSQPQPDSGPFTALIPEQAGRQSFLVSYREVVGGVVQDRIMTGSTPRRREPLPESTLEGESLDGGGLEWKLLLAAKPKKSPEQRLVPRRPSSPVTPHRSPTVTPEVSPIPTVTPPQKQMPRSAKSMPTALGILHEFSQSTSERPPSLPISPKVYQRPSHFRSPSDPIQTADRSTKRNFLHSDSSFREQDRVQPGEQDGGEQQATRTAQASLVQINPT